MNNSTAQRLVRSFSEVAIREMAIAGELKYVRGVREVVNGKPKYVFPDGSSITIDGLRIIVGKANNPLAN